MKRIFILAAVLSVALSLLPAVGFAQSKEDAIRLHKEAHAVQEKAQSHADLKQAEQKYLQAIAIYQKVGERKNAGLACNSLGLIYAALGQYDKAVEYFEKFLAISRELKDRKSEGLSLNNLGNVFLDWGQRDKAVDYYEKSCAIFREFKDRKSEGISLNNLGNVFSYWGQYDKAVDYYEKSLAVAREFKDRKPEANALNNLGLVFSDWGQYDKAVEYYEKSLAVLRELKDRKGEGPTLNNLGNVFSAWGQYDKAVEYYEKSLAIDRELKDRKGEGQTILNVGRVLQHREEHQKALEHFQKGLAIYTEIKVPTRTPRAFIAATYMDLGDLAKAEPLLKEANYNNGWGRFYLLKADFPKAKEYYGKILKSAEENRNADNLFTAYTGLGTACEGLKEDAAAAQHYEKAVKFTEEIRSSLSSAEREKFFDVKIYGFTRTAPYEGLARVQMRQNKPQDAFKTTENTRARVFAEAMTRMSEGKNLAVPPDVVKQDTSINNELAALKKNLQKAYEKNNKLVIESLGPQAKEKEGKLQAHIKMLRDKYPLFAATKYPQPMDLSQTALRDNEWVLSYDVTDPGVIIYLTKGKSIVKALFKPVPRKEMDDLVDKFRKPMEMDETVITAEKLRSFDFATGKRLADILLADVLRDLPKDAPVIIIPGGCLGGLPFEMLVLNTGGTITKDTKMPSVAGADFFGDRNPVSYYQSVTALTLARQFGKQKGAGQKLFVMDDPIFRPDDPRYKKMKQTQRVELLSVLDQDRLQSIRKEKDWNIDRLPRTGELGGSLASLYPGRVDRYTGLEASKKVLFEKPLNNYGSMVFATHGCLDKDLPGVMEPALILTLVDQPKGQDGFLRMSEVMGRLNLTADVVALTACKSGLGHRTSGEGTMGMGRAFQYAGANCVLMSLWSVSESASVKLVENFFRHLKEGKGKLESLKLARDEIRKDGYDHPFYWSAFILVGESDSDQIIPVGPQLAVGGPVTRKTATRSPEIEGKVQAQNRRVETMIVLMVVLVAGIAFHLVMRSREKRNRLLTAVVVPGATVPPITALEFNETSLESAPDVTQTRHEKGYEGYRLRQGVVCDQVNSQDPAEAAQGGEPSRNKASQSSASISEKPTEELMRCATSGAMKSGREDPVRAGRLSYTNEKYQPYRPDILWNTDWGIPKSQISKDDARNQGLRSYRGRWVTRQDLKILRDQYAAYRSLRALSVLTVLGGSMVILVLALIALSESNARTNGIMWLTMLYGALWVAASIGLWSFRRWARNLAAVLSCIGISTGCAMMAKSSSINGYVIGVLMGALFLYYLFRSTAGQIFELRMVSSETEELIKLEDLAKDISEGFLSRTGLLLKYDITEETLRRHCGDLMLARKITEAEYLRIVGEPFVAPVQQ